MKVRPVRPSFMLVIGLVFHTDNCDAEEKEWELEESRDMDTVRGIPRPTAQRSFLSSDLTGSFIFETRCKIYTETT